MYENEKKRVLKTALSMVKYQLVALSGGNVTVRMPDGTFLITPSGMVYEEMIPEDILRVDSSGTVLEGTRRPSVDLGAILDIFHGRPDVNAVIHTHQPYATAIGLIDSAFPACLTTLVDAVRGSVQVAPYLPTADRDMGKLTLEYIGNSLAVILKHHGVMTIGKDLPEALMAAVYLEEAAKSYMAARFFQKFQSFEEREIEHACKEALHYGQPDGGSSSLEEG